MIHGTVLLTLGRLPVALELARAFQTSGWRVVVAEPFRWPMTRLSRSVAKSIQIVAPNVDPEAYLTQLIAVVRDEAVTLVVPVSEEMLYVSRLHGMLATKVPVVCMPYQALFQLYDKWAFNQLLVSIGLPAPASCLIENVEQHPSLFMADYIVKPRLSCAGQGVSYYSAGNIPDKLHQLDGLIAQQQLGGELCCTFAFVLKGSCTELVAYRSLLNAGSVSVCFERMDVPGKVAEQVKTIASHTAFSGMLSFDFMRDGQGQWLAIECNPRATSGLHLLERSSIATLMLNLAEQQCVGIPGKSIAHVAKADKKPARMQEFWSALSTLDVRLLRGRFKLREWRNLISTRDINWSVRDPLPFVLLVVIMWPILWQAIKQKRAVSELLMQDVQWRDQD